MSKTETIDAYNKGTLALTKKFNSSGARIEDVKRGISFVNKENPKVLELGCGNGRDAEEILKYTNNYLGIDASKEMIKLAQEYLPDATFLVADMEEFEFPPNIDIIFAFASLLHSDIKQFKNVLDKAYNALNPNGIFYISIKRSKDYQKVIKTEEFGSRTFYFYSENDIKKMAKGKYKIVYSDEQTLKGVDWLVIILQKN